MVYNHENSIKQTNLTTRQKTFVASRASTGVELDLNNLQTLKGSSLYLVITVK